MNKRFTNLFLSSLLVIVTAAWATDRFAFSFLPPEFSNLWVMILSALGAVSAISGAIKAIQYISDLFFPPKPGPSEEEKLLTKLRELPWTISKEAAREYTGKILEDRSDDFWRQIGENKQNADLFAALVCDPFMLEGLICVYRNELGLLPKNTGALLDKLIRAQWKQEKIDVKQWVELDDMLYVLGKLVIKHAPSVKYPVKISSEGYWKYWNNPYLGMLINIGSWISERKTSRQPLNKLQKWLDNWKSKVYARLEHKPRPLVIAVYYFLNPVKVILYFGERLLFFVFMPVRALTRFILNILENFGMHKATKFIDKIHSNLDFRSKILERDANRLLLAAEKAHLIERSKDLFTFRHKSWVDYFAGHYVAQSSSPIFELTIYDEFNRGWRRLDPDRAGVAICASGLLKNPEQFHRDLLMRDPVLLAQCISSGLELRGEFYENIETTLANELKKVILQVRDAGEWRSVEFSEALQQLRYEPTDALTMLDAIKKIRNDVVNSELAKLIANYHEDVVDILMSRLKTADSEEKRFITLILAWIGDPRAAATSRELLDVVDEDDRFNVVQRMSLVVSAVSFDDADAAAELHTRLFQSMDERLLYWSALRKIGEKALLWAAQSVSTWRDLYPDRRHIIRREFLDLCSTVGNSKIIREALATNLRDKNDPALGSLYIESIGRIKAVEEKDFLMEQLNAVDDTSCLYAIEALGNLGNTAVIPSLKQKLFHRNEQIRETTKDVIEKLSHNSTQKNSEH